MLETKDVSDRTKPRVTASGVSPPTLFYDRLGVPSVLQMAHCRLPPTGLPCEGAMKMDFVRPDISLWMGSRRAAAGVRLPPVRSPEGTKS